LQNLNGDENANRAWENITENIKNSAKESLGLHEWKQHKPWVDKECVDFRWAGHVARMGRGVHRVLVGKPEGKTPLGRPRRKWEDILLRRIFGKWDGVETGWSWLRIGTDGGRL